MAEMSSVTQKACHTPTAPPLGAIGMDLTYKRLLTRERVNKSGEVKIVKKC